MNSRDTLITEEGSEPNEESSIVEILDDLEEKEEYEKAIDFCISQYSPNDSFGRKLYIKDRLGAFYRKIGDFENSDKCYQYISRYRNYRERPEIIYIDNEIARIAYRKHQYTGDLNSFDKCYKNLFSKKYEVNLDFDYKLELYSYLISGTCDTYRQLRYKKGMSESELLEIVKPIVGPRLSEYIAFLKQNITVLKPDEDPRYSIYFKYALRDIRDLGTPEMIREVVSLNLNPECYSLGGENYLHLFNATIAESNGDYSTAIQCYKKYIPELKAHLLESGTEENQIEELLSAPYTEITDVDYICLDFPTIELISTKDYIENEIDRLERLQGNTINGK